MRVEHLAEGVVSIYALCQSDGRVRYVGKTVQKPSRRLIHHINAARRGRRLPVSYWIRKRQASGFRPIVRVLETANSTNWVEREQFWIAFYRSVEPDLLNLTAGGEGLSGHTLSDAHRARISAALRTGQSFNCEVCQTAFWRKRKEIKKGDCRVCSRECYGAYQRGRKRPVSEQFTRAGIAGAAAEKLSRTHCKRGHPLSGDNLFITHGGSRGCKECRKLHKRAYRERTNAVA